MRGAVTVAGRMDSNGLTDSFQVIESTYRLMKDLTHFEARKPTFAKVEYLEI